MVLYIHTYGFIYSYRFTQTAPLSLCIFVSHIYIHVPKLHAHTNPSSTHEIIANIPYTHRFLHTYLSNIYIHIRNHHTRTNPSQKCEHISHTFETTTHIPCMRHFLHNLCGPEFFSCRLAHRKVQRFSSVSREYARKFIYTYMHIFICVYLYVHICTCIYIYIHLHVCT